MAHMTQKLANKTHKISSHAPILHFLKLIFNELRINKSPKICDNLGNLFDFYTGCLKQFQTYYYSTQQHA